MVVGSEGCLSISFGMDPVQTAVTDVLARLERGEPVQEHARVDLKEEAGRRTATGQVTRGTEQNEAAAAALAGEMACMANTDGGGAVIVGVADDRTLLGAALDVEWLRHRVYMLTNNALTIDARETFVRQTRLLVLTAPQAIEPIRYKGKIRWRVGDSCVEVDAATWHSRRMMRSHFDWSSQTSGVSVSEVRATAVEIARDFLHNSGEAQALDLAKATTPQLLRRLNVVTNDGFLTNAGVLGFVGRGTASIDYIRRDVAGGDSTHRLRKQGRPLLEEVAETFTLVSAYNRTTHIRQGLSIGQVSELPELASREAIVNGVVHREWGVSDPTMVEHVGRTLRVTSPGGFFGGVTPENIITHPSQSRNRALAELFAAIRIAEREGVGVDRMVREMIRVGHAPPDIRELAGPYVRTSLVGDVIDEAWTAWIGALEPPELRNDLNALLLLRRLVATGWIDAATAAPDLQLSEIEASGDIARLTVASIDQTPILRTVDGVPDRSEPAYRLSRSAVRALQALDEEARRTRRLPTRESVARSFVSARGRISTTELGSLVGASPTNVGGVIKGLEDEGFVEPSRPNRRGPGFYYRLATRP